MIHSEFNLEIRKKINDFKRIYRQNKINLKEQGLDLSNLHIERKHIVQSTDHELASIVKQLLSHLKSIIENKKHPLHDHRGIGLFISDMQSTLDQYSMIGGKMKHRGRYASEMLIRVSNKISLLLHGEQTQASNEIEQIKKDTLKDIHTIKSLNQSHLITSLAASITQLKQVNLNAYNALYEHIHIS